MKAALDADVLPEAQRLAICYGLCGTQTPRDSKVLTAFEAGLIRDYRRMSSGGRQTVRVVFDAVAKTMVAPADDPQARVHRKATQPAFPALGWLFF